MNIFILYSCMIAPRITALVLHLAPARKSGRACSCSMTCTRQESSSDRRLNGWRRSPSKSLQSLSILGIARFDHPQSIAEHLAGIWLLNTITCLAAGMRRVYEAPASNCPSIFSDWLTDQHRQHLTYIAMQRCQRAVE